MSAHDQDETRHKGMLAWWAKNTVAANLLMIATIVAGIIGYFNMEREVFPSVPFNGVTISVAWPGASPQEVEEQIVLRLEEAVVDIDGIENLTSTAREGSGVVRVEANNSINIDRFINEIESRVNSVSNLPRSSFPPRVRRWQSSNQEFGVTVSGDVDRRELQRIADGLRDEISAEVWGAQIIQTTAYLPEEVSIEVSEEALRQYGLTISEVAQAVRASSLNASGGQVRTATGDVQLAARQLADTREEFENIIVRQTPGGATIRVGDVATVIDGFVDANLAATFDGETVVLLMVRSTERMDVVRTANELEDFIAQRTESLPEGVDLTLWWDNSDAYEGRMSTIVNSAGLGLGMVLIILVLFLRPTVAFWVTIGIATAFFGAFAFLPYLGVSLNMLSLFAFLLVIGIIVDDAIIVGENIHNQVERGEKGLTAAVLGVQLVAKPVIFAVITTIMTFLPWAMLSGPEVQFTRQISIVVGSALFFSLVESLLILPAHLSHMKPQKFSGASGPFLRLQRFFADSLLWFARNIYRPVAKFAIKRRGSTVAAFFGLLIISTVGLLGQGWVPFKFMPDIESEFIVANISLPEGTPYTRVEQISAQLEGAVSEVEDRYTGQLEGGIDLIQGFMVIAQERNVVSYIRVADPDLRPEGMATNDVALMIRQAMGPVPDAEEISLTANFNQDNPGLQFAVNHSDLDELRLAVEDLKNHLRTTYGALYDVTDNLQSAADELRFTLRPDGQALGLTLQDVTNQVSQAYYGFEVQRLPREGNDVRVMVRYPREARRSLDSLADFRIRTADGREVPLAAVADVEFAPGLARINRRDRMRTATVSAEATTQEEVQRIRQELEAEFFPAWQERHPGVRRNVVGDQEAQQEFMMEAGTLFIMMIGGMYVLLAVAFRSYAQPLLIMTAIPFALTGSIFGHVIMGVDMALFSIFGTIAAAGVVVNDNLVLVDFVNRLRAKGVGAYQALVDSGVARFRPILLTSVTTFIGIFPMMAERSTQAQFLKPMVVSLGFAVVFALFVTLFFVPAMYALGVDFKRMIVALWTGKPAEPLGSHYHDTDFAHGEAPGHLDNTQPAE